MSDTLTKKRKMSLPLKMLIAMVLGAIAGFAVGTPITHLKFLGDIFLRLLKMCIYPLVLISIMQGVSQMRDLARLKKVGLRFFAFWLLTGLIIAVMGVALAFTIKPGVGVGADAGEAAEAVSVNFIQNLVGWFPDNPFGALSAGNVLQIIGVAIIFGLILATMPNNETKDRLVTLIGDCNDWISAVVGKIIQLAPIGVFTMMANTVATVGINTLTAVFKMLLTMYVIFLAMYLVFYPLVLLFVCKLNPIQYYKNILPVLIMAFSTCSSSATIPVTMECTKNRMGVPEDIVSLIAAPAATLNMHANCMQAPLYCIFAAQVYGIDLKPSQLVLIMLLGLISAIGAAGVPGGGIIMMTLVLQIMDLPLTVMTWILGIYTFIDMPGTMTNVAGDVLGMVVVSRSMGELDEDKFYDRNGARDSVAI